MRELILKLRDGIHELSCEVALLYLAMEKELEKWVASERRHELFEKFMDILRGLSSIRKDLGYIANELERQEGKKR
jgi:hypothetical protein